MTCGWCMGQGKLDLKIVPTEPLTKQEYLQTCTTKQLIEELSQLCITVINHGGEFELKEEEIIFLKLKIKSWLKQPHTNKE